MSNNGVTDRLLRIGIDVGGTKIAGVIYEGTYDRRHSGGRLVASFEVASRSGAQALIEDIVYVADYLMEKAEETYGDIDSARNHLVSVGIGTPGSVDTKTGTVTNIANLGIERVELGKELERRLGVPVTVENDVNAAALGAYTLLPAHSNSSVYGCDDFSTTVFLNLGTGLAAGVLRHGVLDHGSQGNVGEIGHIPVEPHRMKCGCGQRGCLETAASGGAARRLWPQDNPPMPAIINKAHDDSVPEHELAQEVLATIIGAIADAIMALAVTVDPDTIIIGGGMARTGDPLIEEISEELTRRAASSPFIRSMDLPSRLTLAPCDQPIGAIGAGVAAQRAVHVLAD